MTVMKKRGLVLIGILVLTFLAPYSQAAEEFAVQVRTIEDRKAVFATVESVDQIRARARIGGIISGLAVDEGSHVVAGQKIAVITDKKLPLKRAALDAKLKSMSAQRKLAETDLARANSLRRSGAASQAKLDEAQARLDVIRSEIVALRAEKSIVLQQISEGQVLAPVSGRVLTVAITNGSVIMPGETVAVIARDAYILRLRLPERHAKFLSIGDKVQVGQRGMALGSDVLADATVQQVYPQMENGQVIADVKVSGLDTYFVGERTRVHVATGTRQVIAAPGRFFYQRYGISFAKLKSGDEITLLLGLPTNGKPDSDIEVLSGLKAGDVLIMP